MILSNKIKFVGYGNGIAYVRVNDLKNSMKRIKGKLKDCRNKEDAIEIINEELGAELT